MFGQAAVVELRPACMRGYGALDSAAIAASERLVAELTDLLQRIANYLDKGEQGDLLSMDNDYDTRIVLVRHGHVEGISPERFRGRRDVDLSELGVSQARATAQRIATEWRPRWIYSSPLKRCIQTAEPVATVCNIASTVLEDLNDVDYGDWEWHTYGEVRAQWPDLFERWFRAPHLVRFPNGDSLQDLVARVSNVLRLVLERHRHETIVIVGHSSANRALLLQILDQPLSAYWRLGQDPCSVTEVEVLERSTTLHRVNETHHLLRAP
jgi:phosphoserine phosphatase